MGDLVMMSGPGSEYSKFWRLWKTIEQQYDDELPNMTGKLQRGELALVIELSSDPFNGDPYARVLSSDGSGWISINKIEPVVHDQT